LVERQKELSVMMAPRNQVKLALLAILGVWAMLTFASTDLQAQGTATNPAPTASIPAPAWTAAQQKRIATLMSTYGKVGPLNTDVTAAFGLSKGNEVLSAPILTFNEPPLLRAYISLPDGSMLLVVRDSVTTLYYHLDANQTLIAAVSKSPDQAPVVIPSPDAERNVAAQLRYWAVLADRH
jgi:hypothetical protein